MNRDDAERPADESGLLEIADRLLQDAGDAPPLPDRAALDGLTFDLPFEDLEKSVSEEPGEEDGVWVGRRVGRLRIEGVLGHGGMGIVLRAFDERLERAVAVKALKPGAIGAALRARMLREARALARLDHPGVCRVHDLVEEGSERFLVLELIEGVPLSEDAARPTEMSGRLRVAAEVAEALAAAHAAGIVHRDLKPENVMVEPGGRARVTDFGIARWEGAEGAPPGVTKVEAEPGHGSAPGLSGEETAAAATRIGSIVGTIRYMSPEQARGEIATSASDVYSLGLLLFELVSGEAAYPRELRSEALLEEVGREGFRGAGRLERPELRGLVEACTSFEPDRRPSAADVATRLRWQVEAPARRRRRRRAAGWAIAWISAIALGGWGAATRWLDAPLLAEGEGGRVALVPFIDRTGEPQLADVVEGLTAMVDEQIDRIDQVEAIPASEVRGTLKGLGLEAPTLDVDGARSLARATGANLVVLASMARQDEDYVLEYRAVRQDGGTSRRSVRARDPVAAASMFGRRLGARLRPDLSVAGIEEIFSDDPVVNRLYASGISKYWASAGARARPYFEVCLLEDPEFPWAEAALASIDQLTGEAQKAAERFRELLERDHLDPRLRMEFTLLLASALSRVGAREESDRAFGRAQDLVEADGRPAMRAKVLRELGVARSYQGKLDEAREFLVEALTFYQASARKRWTGSVMMDLANVEMMAGRVGEQRQWTERAAAIADEIGERYLGAVTRGGLAQLAMAEGDLDAALPHYLELRKLFLELGDQRNSFVALVGIAAIALEQRRVDDAASGFLQALEEAGEIESFRASAHLGLAQVALERQRLDEAGRELGAVEAIATGDRESGEFLAASARLAWERGQWQRALELGERAAGKFEGRAAAEFTPWLETYRRSVRSGARGSRPVG